MKKISKPNGASGTTPAVETRATGFKAVEEWQALSQIYENWVDCDLQNLESHLIMLEFIDDAGFSLASLSKIQQFIVKFRAEEGWGQ